MNPTEPTASAEYWSERVRSALGSYAEPLLRQVMQLLLRPRNQWPAEELIERGVATLTNAAVIDRRLADLPPSARKALALIGWSRKPVWRVGHLLSMLAVLEHAEGLAPIQALLESGLVYPVLPGSVSSLKQFEDWLGVDGITQANLFVHPAVTTRAMQESLDLPSLPSKSIDARNSHPSDGHEWLLRTAIAWSRVAETPIRQTQQQSLFKRDLLRFQTDDLLGSPFAEHPTTLPDPGLFALELATAIGLIETVDGEFRAKPNPDLWIRKLGSALGEIWPNLFSIENWNPIQGHQLLEEGGSFPSIALPALLSLATLPANGWVQAEPIAAFVFERHPSWAATLNKKRDQATAWIERLLLGIAFPLRIVEAVQDASGWWFRLGDVGKHLLKKAPMPNLETEFRQTLIVQPNGEMVVFRQGMTPTLIGQLTRFAFWRTLGSACTLEITAESVYRGLETGLTRSDIQRVLEQHGTRAIPATVLDSLQRWSSKRERISVYSAATLLEFTTADDLDAAFARGLVSAKITDRIGIAVGGEEIDYRQFRLVGNRDYGARPQQCIAFEANGVTFEVDTAQSDLILEAELSQIAEPLPTTAGNPRRYALTVASLRQANQRGLTLVSLEQWAVDRSGEPLSPAARLLFPSEQVSASFRTRLVAHLPSELIADGLMQWPPSADLIEERLGPTAIAVEDAKLNTLIELLHDVGIELKPFSVQST